MGLHAPFFMVRFKPLPPLEELQELLAYDLETGVLTWKVSRGPTKSGSVAGCEHPGGYLYVKVNHKRYVNHRICWYLAYGEDPKELTVDHINQIKTDNRIVNLRLASQSEQSYNKTLIKNNTTGHRGVYFEKTRANAKWRAYLNRKHLGTFDTFEEAVAARLQAEREHAIFIHDGLRHS